MTRPLRHFAFTCLLAGAVLLARAVWPVFVPVTTAVPSEIGIQSLVAGRLALAVGVLAVAAALLLVPRVRRPKV